MKRKYHHYLKCEEYLTNMWKQVPVEKREQAVLESRDLMLNIPQFTNAMKNVVDNWPYSCEANLTASVINHQAWLGHAGCAFNHDAPEYLTRLAWSMLNEEQQNLANLAADEAKQYWVEKYAKN
jgi:hypothetical protein